MPLCGPVTVTELLTSGDMEFESIKENRIRQWAVTSDNGCAIYPANVTNPANESIVNITNPAGTPAGIWLWAIDQTYHFDSAFTGFPLAPGVQGYESTLRVRRTSIKQLAPTALKVTAVYSTERALWDIRRRVEVVTESAPLLRDLDARDHFDGAGCFGNFSIAPDARDWCSLVAAGDALKGDEFLISSTEGIDVPIAKYNVVYSGLFIESDGSVGDIGRLVNKLNPAIFAGSDPQTVLLKSFTAEHVRDIAFNAGQASEESVWRMELRFEFDEFFHRMVLPLRIDGGISNKARTKGTAPNDRIQWRSARVFEVALDWNALPAGVG